MTARRTLTPRARAQGAPGQGRKAVRPAVQTPSKRPQARRTAKKAPEAVSSVLSGMREATFQRIVRKALEARGYVVWVFPIMKRTVAGVPDLTFWHPLKPGRLYCWELKTATGKVRPEQAIALAHLSTVPGVDARIVRPSDWRALSEEV